MRIFIAIPSFLLLVAAGMALPAVAEEPLPADPPAQQRIAEGKHFLPNISLHEPLYFLFGVSEEYDTNAKFQLSFKYRLFPRYSRHFYFAYTQLSVWDLGKESSPFHDTSYRPSFFYFYNEDKVMLDGGYLFRMTAGLEHESNGKADPDSRSINIAFARPQFILGSPGRNYQFTIAPKVWGYIEKSDNPDIDDYRGYADVQLMVEKVAGRLEGLQVALLVRKGAEQEYGSYQIDISYPDDLLRFGYWYLQYFSGWGETILDYDLHVKPQVRFGMMAVRW